MHINYISNTVYLLKDLKILHLGFNKQFIF